MSKISDILRDPEELKARKHLIDPILAKAIDLGSSFAVMTKLQPLPTMLELLKARRYLQRVLWGLSVQELRNWSPTATQMTMVQIIQSGRERKRA